MSNLDIMSLALNGHQDISTGDTGDWQAIKAINGDVTLGTGCEVIDGDAPQDGDVVSQNDVWLGRFSKLVYSGDGRLIGYPTKK
jgi:hypothetical protein